jgi:tetratricopeptide (TPR) repeat protein
VIETQDWQIQPLTDQLTADELLALGLSAVNLQNAELAQQVTDRLGTLSEASPQNADLKISYLEVAAMTRFLTSHGRSDSATLQQQGMAMLQEAIELSEQGRLPNGAANPLKPAHELAGEALLFAGQYAEAAKLFEQSLLRMPNRTLSLLGAARAYDAAGDTASASVKYQTLLAVQADDSRAGAQEAMAYLDP